MLSPPSRWERFLLDSSFIRHYLWKYRNWVAIGLVALVLVDALEVVPPILLKQAVDLAVEQGPRLRLLQLAAIYFGIALAQGVCRYGWRMYLIRSSLFAGRDLRGSFARHLFSMPSSFYDRHRVGDLMSLSASDIEAVRMAIGAGLLTFADALFYIATVPIAMYWLSPQLLWVAIVPLPLIPWLVMRNEREVHSRFGASQAQFSQISALAQENLGGVRVVKAFAREDAQASRFRKAGEEFIRLNLRLARVQTAFGPSLDFVMSLGLVLLLWVGGKFAIQGAVTIGTFVAFQRYIQKMVWPMTALGMSIMHYQRAVASSARIKDVLGEKTDVPEAPQTELPIGAAPGGPWKTAGRVEFRDLTFRFPGCEAPALRNISLTIEAGARVSFVGAIGSGKSALLALLPRVYACPDGSVFLDGVDVNRWPIEELRRQVGYVGQDVFLFSDSVLENVAFGLGVGASGREERVRAAARAASVEGDVERLSEGYDTRVGERGVSVSGGQKQRLTLARALVREPSVLILDDALSSVDVRTERSILSGLRARSGRNTELIAAHRISTVKESDRIVVLHEGQVIESGSHAELLAKPALYARFYEQQRLREDLESYVEKLDPAEAEGARA